MRAGGVPDAGDKHINGALGEQSTGVAEVIQQIWVVGSLSEGGIEVRDRFASIDRFRFARFPGRPVRLPSRGAGSPRPAYP